MLIRVHSIVDRDGVDEARPFLVKNYAGGDEPSPLVTYELEEIRTTVRLEREF